jgi:hypothetical protein
MASLQEDIKTSSDWIVKAFGSDKLRLDHSVESLKLLDDFFDKHSANGKAKPNGRLSQNLGATLFSIGSYLGETIIRNVPGSSWRTNDEDPQGEVDAEVVLPDGTTLWPMQRVIKRFKEGAEDGIYAYGAVAIREMGPGGYWKKIKQTVDARNASKVRAKKPWWKFW